MLRKEVSMCGDPPLAQTAACVRSAMRRHRCSDQSIKSISIVISGWLIQSMSLWQMALGFGVNAESSSTRRYRLSSRASVAHCIIRCNWYSAQRQRRWAWPYKELPAEASVRAAAVTFFRTIWNLSDGINMNCAYALDQKYGTMF
jgi:hypothetical protein